MHNSFSLKGAALQGGRAVVKSYAFGKNCEHWSDSWTLVRNCEHWSHSWTLVRFVNVVQIFEHWSDLWTVVRFVNVVQICEHWSDLWTLVRFVNIGQIREHCSDLWTLVRFVNTVRSCEKLQILPTRRIWSVPDDRYLPVDTFDCWTNQIKMNHIICILRILRLICVLFGTNLFGKLKRRKAFVRRAVLIN